MIVFSVQFVCLGGFYHHFANLFSFINTDVALVGNISIIKAKASPKRFAGKPVHVQSV